MLLSVELNFRMQNDVKLSPEQRRKWANHDIMIILRCTIQLNSYKHVVDGVRRVTMEGTIIKIKWCSLRLKILFLLWLLEGFFKLWTGASLNILRAVLMTLSQVSFNF